MGGTMTTTTTDEILGRLLGQLPEEEGGRSPRSVTVYPHGCTVRGNNVFRHRVPTVEETLLGVPDGECVFDTVVTVSAGEGLWPASAMGRRRRRRWLRGSHRRP